MAEWKKPLPTITGETMPYWEACRRGELLIQRCQDCNQYQFYPRGICANCFTGKVRWVKASGKGTVWTFTVTRQNRTPGFDEGPYVLALVELEEGVKMFSNIVDCDPFQVKIGMPVEVTFVKATNQVSVPFFKPAE
ncbi:MAG: Zn-ribbon domain-containing OB-fold protein [Dehalococcoidia bacterium]|nr:Zn-ribbon domain-containing OB-fold protein [Chloroflexota bacterium]